MHYLSDQTSNNNNSTSPFKSYLREKRGEEGVTSQNLKSIKIDRKKNSDEEDVKMAKNGAEVIIEHFF